LASLVDREEPLAELPLGDAQQFVHVAEPLLDSRALRPDPVDLGLQRVDPRLLGVQAALERVELDQGRMRPFG